jgi:hypothetical protein
VRRESGPPQAALPEKIQYESGDPASQDIEPVDNSGRAEDGFPDWLVERLDNPHIYDLEAELLQAGWSR